MRNTRPVPHLTPWLPSARCPPRHHPIDLTAFSSKPYGPTSTCQTPIRDDLQRSRSLMCYRPPLQLTCRKSGAALSASALFSAFQIRPVLCAVPLGPQTAFSRSASLLRLWKRSAPRG